ncbi:phytanoyl-CoA dioxygenase family protein [Parasphingorhabdus cellanae]|uniref:Phytanoyl-CoA dioxygenase family protein n=1 Tax=Parasphingorhabdus cellanae TaxID=2806553 RepID=A0ABX7T9Z8_9SPHN|nr:phytanoyl-CoA dioxygenase family protein [Parasphingorhabdus cellanae]QTD57225.1 phytanoyl-CoA dioxygenase family protein [Parasphingorhabdus cellanae]
MAQLQRLSASSSPDQLAEVLKTDGAAIVENVLDAAALDRLRAEIMPYVEATEPGRDDFTGRKTTRTGALVARSAACRALVMDDLILGGANAFLKPFCERVQLHLTQLIRIQPGQVKQPLHRDRLAWGGFLQDSIEPQFNTIWAVTDFTQENGATQVVPDSNNWEAGREAKPDEIQYAEMKAGSVLVYSGSVIHSGGANQADHDRMGLNITYALGWLRQEENQYLSCPPHIAKDFDPALRDLLGYCMGSYALGYYTPPTGPGDGPEVVPPQHLFSGKVTDWSDGDDLYKSVSRRSSEKV